MDSEGAFTEKSFSRHDLERVQGIVDRAHRALLFVGLLTRKLALKSRMQQPIVVGGGAVEVYTAGGYTSQDIDLVMLDSAPAERILADSGFAKEGRYWIHPDLDLLVEFPGSTLTYGPEAYQRLFHAEVDGEFAWIIGIEDILIGRIWSGISEKRDHDLQVAREMIALNRESIDWAAAKLIAGMNGPETVAALERLRNAP
jgi:hypothetical protein